ncbi:ATP-dependent helicase [Synechococcus sp. CBW1108]|uniref:UvrD-helicase domain-containing protein n=1 Tax=Synechococcus sp. CBW1108 TaxID=1353147 RepID=UPI0018CC92E5|nr:ATP-dependent helicase [Synechococcus sp. CBW1108]QPN68802.1 ATP-dependent helicase [Synechococcus sp. CBW1108]
MITLADLIRAVSSFRPPPDSQQFQAVNSSANTGLFIVAGPGTGKTASITLRILKLALVDGIPPRGILATTFTKKAAEELRSRILGWGFRIIDALREDKTLSLDQAAFLGSIDINQIRTGTVDSLCEQLLREFRAPGTQPPVLVDDFVSKTLMLREGMFGDGRYQNNDLDAFLLDLHSETGSRYNFHAGTKSAIVKQIWERRFQDQVDWHSFSTLGPAVEQLARTKLEEAHSAYESALSSAGLVDFSLLENEVLQRLKAGQLTEFTDQLQVVLVDEYQDTNLLQEELYFELANACGGALTVVGDDDQSLYRFRGATVDLFRDFPTRYNQRFEEEPEQVFLANNYRSSKSIISFVNGYATLDAGYQAVRVSGKPPLAHGPKAPDGIPVLGMFRDTLDLLATDLAAFIHDVFRGTGSAVPGGRVKSDPTGGNVGDCALLCSSPAEYSASDRPRLPLLLRQELASLNPPIDVFNPRGEEIATVEVVERFGGLLLEALDPGGVVQGQTNGISLNAQQVFTVWRQRAINYTQDPSAPMGLLAYAQGWANRDPARNGYRWPGSTSVIELVYGLVHYFPELHDDPEGQVYLEVFTRQLGACAQVGKFDGRVVADPSNVDLSDASIKELLRDFLSPIADGVVGVNEDLMESFPRNRLSVLSIHQSKGLEFPLTIVDVGSDFKDLRSPKFKRHPDAGSPAHRMENLLRQNSALGVPTRSEVNRAFDDLYRQFFVAFSRPQDVLLLVGVTPTQPGGRVPNVATGWDRDGVCRWARNLPYQLI